MLESSNRCVTRGKEGRKEEKEEEEAQAAASAAGLQKPGPRAPPASNGTAKHIRVITW